MACARRVGLTAEDAGDDARLAEAVYRLLEGQRGRRMLSTKVRRLQSALRKLVDDRAWKAYLRVEEAVNDRADRELLLVARWALREGARTSAGRADRPHGEALRASRTRPPKS